VLERAGQIMTRLKERDAGLQKNLPSDEKTEAVNHKKNQVNEKKLPNALVRELSALNIDTVTPLAALNLVSKWKKLFAEGSENEKSSPNTKTTGGKAGDTAPSLFD
jgi:DNA mismatch repair ATPase MutS